MSKGKITILSHIFLILRAPDEPESHAYVRTVKSSLNFCDIDLCSQRWLESFCALEGIKNVLQTIVTHSNCVCPTTVQSHNAFSLL